MPFLLRITVSTFPWHLQVGRSETDARTIGANRPIGRTTERPGVVLRRAIGPEPPFSRDAELVSFWQEID